MGEQKKPNPLQMRRYVRAIARAIKKVGDRKKAKNQIKEDISKIKKLSSEEQIPKDQLHEMLKQLENKITRVVHDEQELVEEQKEDGKIISELSEKVDELRFKMHRLGEKYEEQIKTSLRTPEERQKRIKEIEDRIKSKQKQEETAKKDQNEKVVKEIEEQLAVLEKKHFELVKSGKHPQEHLIKIQEIIHNHKNSLRELRGQPTLKFIKPVEKIVKSKPVKKQVKKKVVKKEVKKEPAKKKPVKKKVLIKSVKKKIVQKKVLNKSKSNSKITKSKIIKKKQPVKKKK